MSVFLRWTVVYKHDQQPIEGCMYVHKDKARKRMRGMANPQLYELKHVAVMSKEFAELLASKLEGVAA